MLWSDPSIYAVRLGRDADERGRGAMRPRAERRQHEDLKRTHCLRLRALVRVTYAWRQWDRSSIPRDVAHGEPRYGPSGVYIMPT